MNAGKVFDFDLVMIANSQNISAEDSLWLSFKTKSNCINI